MLTSRAHLLRLRHDPAFDFSLAEVEYVDRGAPGDLSRISGDKIIKLEQGWMQIAAVDGVKFIPFHRIRRIIYRGSVVWEKRDKPEHQSDLSLNQ
ncbi:MAG TPA: DUF504 domain-containing protein [Methanothrix sp.]|nr:DUF504 domain-containing protein [Methanothrix sp.]